MVCIYVYVCLYMYVCIPFCPSRLLLDDFHYYWKWVQSCICTWTWANNRYWTPQCHLTTVCMRIHTATGFYWQHFSTPSKISINHLTCPHFPWGHLRYTYASISIVVSQVHKAYAHKVFATDLYTWTCTSYMYMYLSHVQHNILATRTYTTVPLIIHRLLTCLCTYAPM